MTHCQRDAILHRCARDASQAVLSHDLLGSEKRRMCGDLHQSSISHAGAPSVTLCSRVIRLIILIPDFVVHVYFFFLLSSSNFGWSATLSGFPRETRDAYLRRNLTKSLFSTNTVPLLWESSTMRVYRTMTVVIFFLFIHISPSWAHAKVCLVAGAVFFTDA